jgi:hypothetical protein
VNYHISPRERKKRRLKLKIKLYSVLLAFGLLVIGVAYVIRESPIFQVKEVRILGLGDDEKKSLLQTIQNKFLSEKLKIILGYNNYLVWPKEIALANVEYASVGVNKKFFARSIEINVKKRERMGIWCYSQTRNNAEEKTFESDSQILETDSREQSCFWFDEFEGMLIEKAPETKGQIIYNVSEKIDGFRELGDNVMPLNLFQNFKKILDVAISLNLALADMRYETELEEITLFTVSGAQLIFNLRIDPEININDALEKILSERDLKKINYIDMTVENKIYIK